MKLSPGGSTTSGYEGMFWHPRRLWVQKIQTNSIIAGRISVTPPPLSVSPSNPVTDPGFHMGAGQLANVQFFPQNCMKLKEFGPGARIPDALPLDPPMQPAFMASQSTIHRSPSSPKILEQKLQGTTKVIVRATNKFFCDPVQ